MTKGLFESDSVPFQYLTLTKGFTLNESEESDCENTVINDTAKYSDQKKLLVIEGRVPVTQRAKGKEKKEPTKIEVKAPLVTI